MDEVKIYFAEVTTALSQQKGSNYVYKFDVYYSSPFKNISVYSIDR